MALTPPRHPSQALVPGCDLHRPMSGVLPICGVLTRLVMSYYSLGSLLGSAFLGQPTPQDKPSLTAGRSRLPVKPVASCRILLVEDEVFSREMLRDMLGAVGMVVDVAENGQVAVSRVRQQSYDLILMDIRMPVMDGITATRHIRALPSGANIPVIALTASETHLVRQQGQEAGINDFVKKPLTMVMLQELLTNWIRSDGNTDQGSPAWQLNIADIDVTNPTVQETDPMLYAGFLQDFVDTYGRSMSRLRGYVMAGAVRETTELLGAVCSSSALIGLSGVQHLAQAMIEAVKRGDNEVDILMQATELEAKLLFINEALMGHVPAMVS